MRIERDMGITESLTIYEAKMPPGKGTLDPINVILRDFCGQGQIIVECYGSAWSHWFGAIGDSKLREFIAGCDEYYLATKLTSTTTRATTKREESYVQHIARAVIESLKGGSV